LDPIGTNTADKFTENATVGVSHKLFEANTNVGASAPLSMTIALKDGVTNGRRYVLVGELVTNGAVFDLQTGTVFANLGTSTGSMVSLGNGWYDCTVTSTTGTYTNYQIFLSSDGTTFTYNGDNVSNVYLYNARITQSRVSALTDQSGSGNNASQATLNSQMITVTNADGLVEIGNPTDAEKSLTFGSGLYTPFTGDGQPQTVLAVVRRVATPAAGTFGVFRFSAAGTARRDLMQYNVSNRYVEVHTADDAGSKSWTSGTTAVAAYSSAVSVMTATTESLYQDGVGDGLNPRNVDLNTQTWNAASTNARSRMIRELVVFNRALTDSERKAVENAMRVRWGLSALP